MKLIKIKREISETNYIKLMQRTKEQINDYVLNAANNSTLPPCGYGFYNPQICKEDGKYYATWECYDSCD